MVKSSEAVSRCAKEGLFISVHRKNQHSLSCPSKRYSSFRDNENRLGERRALVVLVMGLVPPMHETVYDADRKERDGLSGNTTRTSTYTTTHLVYWPVWRAAPRERGEEGGRTSN
jgi:hypothetical protein